MDIKQWKRQMGEKFLIWRKKNRYSGLISVPEVAHFSMEVINEVRIMKK